VIEREDRDLGSLVVRRAGSLVATGDLWDTYQLLDSSGAPVTAAAAYFGELQAAGRSTATQRSYGIYLLRWFRFLWTGQIPWREATRTEARDFSRWIQITAKPVRPHWRSPDKPPVVKPKTVNPVTGKRPPGRTYAPATVAHCVLVTWNLAAVEIISLWWDHGLRRLVGHGGAGGEVAGARPPRAGGCLASGVG
jgi:hypothetical protein